MSMYGRGWAMTLLILCLELDEMLFNTPDEENAKNYEGCYFKKIGTEDGHLSKDSFPTFRFGSRKKNLKTD